MTTRGVCAPVRSCLALAAILGCWLGSSPRVLAQSAGDVAFTGWNSDGNDDLVFVTFVDIAAGTKIYFRDDEYDSGWDGTGEGACSWTAPAGGITAGTVVQVYDCTVAAPTASVGTCTREDATFDIANAENAVYAYTAPGWNTSPFTFLAAFCNATSFGTLLNGTGLTDGTDAWSWDNLDNWRYNGIRTGTVAELKAALQNSSNWSSADGSGDQSYDFVLSPFVIQSGAAPEIAVLGTNLAEIASGDDSPSATDGTHFGSVAEAGAAAVTNTFSITNAGSAALILTATPSVSLSGDADFSVGTQPASTNLAAGAVVTFRIVFNPAAGGARTSLVTIANNDSNEDPYRFAIRGTGAVPDIAVLGTNGAVIADGDDSPAKADGTSFGSFFFPGTAGITNTFSITNAGAAALVLTGDPSVTLSGDADFSMDAQPASTNLAAGAVVTFRIAFDPAASGLRTSLVSIASTDGDENPYRFAVQGTGIPPVAPSVTTSNMAAIGTDEATGGGLITSDGGDAVTNKGLCWGAAANPTVEDAKTSEGGGTNGFASTITGLTPGDVYHVRAYAQNGYGTGYGGDVVFTAACFSAPAATAASGVLDSQFTANWDAAGGASGYLLDVSTSATFSVAATGGGLFISQYYEGSGFDKWIELYNAGAAAVDLTNATHRLGLYSNARRESWKTNGVPDNTIALTGTVAAGATFVLRHPSASNPGYAAADQESSTVVNFNGDDSVVLYTGATFYTAGVIDSIGLTGNSLENTSVVRRADITAGATGTGDYDPSDWIGFTYAAVDAAAAGTAERIGWHQTLAGDYVPGYEARETGGATSFAVTGLTLGVTYYYRVRATNDGCVSGHSNTQEVTTVATAGGVTLLGTTSPTDTVFALDGQVSAGEYGLTAAVLSASGFFTNLLIDADYEHLMFALQYSNRSTVVWTPGSTGVLLSNDFGTASFTVEPAAVGEGCRVSGFGRNNGINAPTNGHPDAGFAIMGSNNWTSLGTSYFTNSVTVSNGYRVSFSNLTFLHRRYSASGPDQWRVSYRIDGLGSYIAITSGALAAADAWETNEVDLAAIPDVVGESAVEFRYDAWGAREGSTQLTAGALAIIGYNLAGAEDFAFVVLQAIPEGTVIEFTDNGWMVPEETFRTNESHFTSWTATTAYAVGDVVDLDLYNMNNDGDQWCAYQVQPGVTAFVYAVNAYHTNWQDSATNNETSALYPGLTNGVTAVAIGYQNACYTGITAGTHDQLLASIGDPLNWTGSTSIVTLPTNLFVVTDAGSEGDDVAWSVDSVGVSGRIDPGSGEDSTSEVILVFFDTDAGDAMAGVTNLAALSDSAGFLRQAVTFSGADGDAADPLWVRLVAAAATNWFDADFAAVVQPGVGGAAGAGFFGIDRDSPGSLTPLTHEALNSKGENTAEFSIPWSSVRDFAAAQAADLLTECETSIVYVFAVAAVATNSTALEENSPPNHSGAGDGAILFTNVWQMNLAPAFAEPTEKAATAAFSNSTGATHLEWTGGNGLFSLVLMRQGGPVDAAPVDGVLYAADPTFGDGDEIGVSNYVVAVTNGNSCWVYGLEEGEQYHVAIYEANGLGTCSDYLGDPRRASQTFTLVVLFSFDVGVEGDEVRVCWETASEILTLGFWVQRRNPDGSWTTIHPGLIPAEGFFNGGVGARYCITDPGAVPGGTYVYRLIEVEVYGLQNVYGPFERTAYALRLESPVRVVPGGVAIRWLSRTNEAYRVFRSADLAGAFSPIATGLLATPPENVYTDSAGCIGFYLISVEPPE